MEWIKDSNLYEGIVDPLNNPKPGSPPSDLKEAPHASLDLNVTQAAQKALHGAQANKASSANLPTMPATASVTSDYKKILQEWANKAPPELKADYLKVKRVLLQFFENSQQTKIELKNYGITSLPDAIWQLTDCQKRLKTLEITNCDLLQNLNLGKLPGLEHLQIQNCPSLSTFSSIGQLEGLITLTMVRLPSLSDCLSDIGNAQNLRMLVIKSLPSLTTLPPNIGLLQSLSSFVMQDCHLTDIPDNILELPHEATVDLSECEMPADIIIHLRHRATTPSYLGPTLRLPEARATIDTQEVLPELPLAQILKQVYTKAGKHEPSSTTLLREMTPSQQAELRTWLNRISFTVEGGEDGGLSSTTSRAFFEAVVSNLELAEKDARFRDSFWIGVGAGCVTCGDRVALSILRMGIARQRLELRDASCRKTWDCLKKAWAIDLLEECAISKIVSLRPKKLDEIELLLAYPVKLKKNLDLQLDVQAMRFSSKEVTKEDLERALAYVQDHWKDKEACTTYLLGQPEWIMALKKKYPQEMQEIEKLQQKRDASDVEEDEALRIHTDMQNHLTTLTIRSLDEL